jgi:hypothetical protein
LNISSFVVACIQPFNDERNICGVVVRGIKYADRVDVCYEEYIVGWYMILILRPSFLLGEVYGRG